jgi:hypothetical protein
MAVKNKYFDPKQYYYKVIAICVLMGLDIILNSFTQFLDYGSTNIIRQYQITDYEKDPGDSAYALLAYLFINEFNHN